MPELPDLTHIRNYLQGAIVERTITATIVKQPVVLRVAFEEPFEDIVQGKRIHSIGIHGPFLHFGLSEQCDVIINLMLGGKLQHQRKREKAEGHLCCGFHLDDDSHVNLCDDQLMAKVYVVRAGDYSTIPKYSTQGIDILSPDFTAEVFHALAAKHARKQVRVFINDHTLLSSIGNAYADEILFDARIHPKTFLGKLSPEDMERLYLSIGLVMKWGMKKVAEAGKPIHMKVRDHMKVRNRHGEVCPRCGTTIRREGVRGYDVFFCPSCQPASRKLFIDWTTH